MQPMVDTVNASPYSLRRRADFRPQRAGQPLTVRAGHADIVELLWPYECCGKDGEGHNAYWYSQRTRESGTRIREILDLEGQGKVRRREKVTMVEESSV